MLIAGILFFLGLFGLPVLAYLHDIHYFGRQVERGAALSDAGKRAEAIALLEGVTRKRAFLGPPLKVAAHYILGRLYHLEGRYAEAAGQIESALACLPEQGRDAGLEAECYLTLYETRLAMGDAEGAADTLRRAEAAAEIEPSAAVAPAMWRESRGKLRELRGKHSEAAVEFRAALEATPENMPPLARVTTVLRIAIACYNAARYRESVDACQQAIDLNASADMTVLALNQAVVSAAALNEMNRAGEYLERLEALSRAQGSHTGALARANLQFLRGELDAALETVAGLEIAKVEDRNVARGVRYEVAMARGEYDVAVAVINESLGDEHNPFPTLQRRSDATMQWALARAYLGLNDPERAARAAETALATLRDDEIFAPYLTVLLLEADARRDPTAPGLRERLAELEKTAGYQQAERDGEPTAARDLREAIGRAAYACGEWGTALTNLRVALAAGVRPVGVARARFAEGECLHRLGRDEEAREAWHRAAETGLDTHYARLARRRLLGQEVAETGIVA
jgi:tetratricopeptide (TPR) repeat protein